jgi:hypothetical protein
MSVSPAAAQAVDASSPQAAAKSLTAAVARGDADTVRSLIVVQNDPEQQLANAYSHLLLAAKRLSEAAKKRYPGGTDPFAAGGITPEEATNIDAAVVHVEQDLATLTIKGRERPMKLRKVGESWKVIISEEPEQSAQQRDRQVALVQGMADAMNASADDINAGRFRDVEEARNAFRTRLGAVIARAAPAASGPAEPAP